MNTKSRLFEIFSNTDNQVFTAFENQTILEAMRQAELSHTCVCNGQARCSTCRITVVKGLENCLPRNDKEHHIAEKLGFPPEIRLACQTKITGNIIIRRLVIDDLDINIVSNQMKDSACATLGKEQNCAILFTDIENYTAFAESVPAYDLVHVLNRYYYEMNKVVTSHNGIISDVAGDGVLALFGTLHENPDSVLDAVETVRDMHGALNKLNSYMTRMFKCEFGVRAGINYGKVIVGAVHAGFFRKIAAIGDEVNMASRLETANKKLGTRILVSQSAFEQLQGRITPANIFKKALKGKTGKHRIYEVMLE